MRFLLALATVVAASHEAIPTTLNYKLGILQDDGLALTPPLGWRSWNCYGAEVTDQRMRQVVDAMVMKKFVVNGVPTSLQDLGYNRIGLDDNWQACGRGLAGTFHDARGNPLINTQRFANMKAMNDYIHSKGLLSGWYHNNCICAEHSWPADLKSHYVGDVNATVALGFDEVKLDGCGIFRDLDLWSQLLNATGRKVLIENCHWGADLPTLNHCPFHFFRTSGDISASYSSMFRNLQTTIPFQNVDRPLSRPGCWAYPDMLEVGNIGNFYEERAHFGAWVIVSSPLILSYDVTNPTIYDRVWPIVSNKEALAINQAWFGHPGRLVESYNPAPNGTMKFIWAVPCQNAPDQSGWSFNPTSGELKFGDQCVDSATRNELTVRPCNHSPTQRFEQRVDGTFRTTSGDCVDVYNFEGPSVELYSCNGGCNQKFSLSNGRLADTCQPPAHPNLCFAARANKPGGGDLIQIWAKPVSNNGSMAVLVMNSDHDASNHVVTVNLAPLGLTGRVSVRDVWSKSTIGTASGTFTTDPIPGYDSRLYVFTKMVGDSVDEARPDPAVAEPRDMLHPPHQF